MMKTVPLHAKGNVLKNRFAFALAALLGLSLVMGVACAETTPEYLTTLGRNLYISSIISDPTAFFSGDKGTVTVYVANGNANQSVSVNHASFGDNDFKCISGSYDTSSNIGPMQTRTYTFSVLAVTSKEGTYYPSFSISWFGSQSIWQNAAIPVDNSPIVLLVSDKPDTFKQGREDTIEVQIANPRKNDVKNVILSITGTDAEVTPSKIYIGKLESGASTTVNFTVTPVQQTTLELDVDYDNGDNAHSVTTWLPVTFADDKKRANPVLSNIKVTKNAGIYHVTGDVTNAGLLTANAVTVTSLSPAVPDDPYKSYIIGALKQDDFGSFEVTFKTEDAGSVPLQLSYKDKDGNVITSVQQVNLGSATNTDQQNSGPGISPVIVVVILVVLVGGGYYYMKRRKSR